MSGNTYNNDQWDQSSVASLRLKVGAIAAAFAVGAILYDSNSEKINDLFQPRTPVPPVTQVYNNQACLAYNDRIYDLKPDIARKGEGIDALLSRRGQFPTPTLQDAFRAANGLEKSMLRERRQYLVPAPDKGNKCK